MSTVSTAVSIIAIGSGATLVMDIWLVVLRRFGVRTASFGMIGRWVAHLFRGQLVHASIAKAEPVRGEDALGWLVHYAIGIVFASMLIAMTGTEWIEAPTPAPAVLFGVISLAAPWLVMQPAMGLGFFASKSPTPMANCFRSAATHVVFGAGLYVATIVVAQLA